MLSLVRSSLTTGILRFSFPQGLLTHVFIAALVCIAPNFSRADDTIDILFVHSRTSTPYLNFIEKVKRELREGSPLPVNTVSQSASQLSAEHATASRHSYDLVVALGTQAARAIQQWQPDIPVLYALIPRATFADLKNAGNLVCPDNRCTAIYIDQPLQRIFRILAAAFDKRQQLGVLLGPASSRQQDTLASLAGETGFTLHTARILQREQLLPALDSILKQSDLLLSIADPVIYNRRTTKSILLTTYRYKVPVVAYSKAYADAGATLSVFSTPEQIAVQAAAIIRAYFEKPGSGLPDPQYPEHYSIRINQHVAESLGLNFGNNPEFQSIINEADNE